MKAKVFVSCGQHSEEEKRIAHSVCQLLQERGFSAYLAIDVQTILDINRGIIRELKNSDYYLFVNFRRERIKRRYFRGSLFSNQELAIAYALGFERMLIVNQADVQPEGMLRYIGVNTETFQDQQDCLNIIRRALDRAGWIPDYSRRLSAANPRFADQLLTFDRLSGWFLYLDVVNHRPDISALEATGRLWGYSQDGSVFQPSDIRSPLKATGRPGFSHTIFPKSHEAFDLLCIGSDLAADVGARISPTSPLAASGQYFVRHTPCRVYLNSALDVRWSCPIAVTSGLWIFRYEIFAIDFPLLTVDVEVDVPVALSEDKPSARLIAQEVS